MVNEEPGAEKSVLPPLEERMNAFTGPAPAGGWSASPTMVPNLLIPFERVFTVGEGNLKR
jgi:hypothetical protein